MNEDAPRSPVRALIRVLLIVALVAFVLTGRVVLEGERQIRESTRALEAGDADLAIFHARAAALWYAPGAPHVRVAYQRLLAIAREAERRKLWETSLLGYRAVESASASTRWLVRPHEAEVAEAEQAVTRIETARRARSPDEASEPLDLSAVPLQAAPAMRVLLVASFVALIAGLTALLLRGVDETGRMSKRLAWPGIAVACVGFLGYVAALLLA